MSFFKVGLQPHTGCIFYVVIQASTSREAGQIALGRYANCKLHGSPSPFSGPERRL